jgi:hypothetical protein
VIHKSQSGSGGIGLTVNIKELTVFIKVIFSIFLTIYPELDLAQDFRSF